MKSKRKIIGFRSMDNVAMRIICCMHWRAYITVHVYLFLWKLIVQCLNATFEYFVGLKANISIYYMQEMQKFSTDSSDIYFGSVFRYFWTQVRVHITMENLMTYIQCILMLYKIQRLSCGLPMQSHQFSLYLTHD